MPGATTHKARREYDPGTSARRRMANGAPSARGNKPL